MGARAWMVRMNNGQWRRAGRCGQTCWCASMLVLLAAGAALPGCMHSLYVTPVAQAADFSAGLGADGTAVAVEPIASGRAALPVRLGLARVQSYGRVWAGSEWFAPSMTGLVDEAQVTRVRTLPGVADVATVPPALVGEVVNEGTLRRAAARMGLDVLLLVTFQCQQDGGDALVPLSVVTLGLSPSHVAQATVTASGVLLDVRSGEVLGTIEAQGGSSRLGNTYTARDAAGDAARAAEREAAGQLVEALERGWPAVQGRIMAGAGVISSAGAGRQAGPQGAPVAVGGRTWPTTVRGAEPPPGGAVYRTDGW